MIGISNIHVSAQDNGLIDLGFFLLLHMSNLRNLNTPVYDLVCELFRRSCRKRTRINSNQTFYRKSAQEGKVWRD
jgi:hypothetical protein